MASSDGILAIDVGAGTQDILIYEADKAVENCVQLVLPSPTVVMARRVARATRDGKAIYLDGNVMGGGALTCAVRAHVEMGLRAYASPLAAATIHDDPTKVEAMGVGIVEAQPLGSARIDLHDVDLATLQAALAPFEVALPSTVAVAVQDHGYSPRESNRLFRFSHWRRFVAAGGEIADLLYLEPPPYMTRMVAVRRDVRGAHVMDTGAAAVWGALCDEEVAGRRHEGVIVVNVGNGHTIGVLLRGSRILGLFEHHTGNMTAAKLEDYVERLRSGALGNDEVFADGGHGCCIAEGFRADGGFRLVAVTGPNRGLAAGLGYHFAVPYGDMMLTGCFGLVAAVRARRGEAMS